MRGLERITKKLTNKDELKSLKSSNCQKSFWDAVFVATICKVCAVQSSLLMIIARFTSN